MEQWKKVQGYESKYEVSDQANLRLLNGRPVKCYVGSNGYLYKTMAADADGNRKHSSLHALVAQAFLGPIPEGHEINHKNGNRKDARAENLEYVTRGQNHSHAYALGRTTMKGKSYHRVSPEKVRAIRAATDHLKVTAAIFGVSIGTVSLIKNRKIYKEIT